jgi:hypothetical protein
MISIVVRHRHADALLLECPYGGKRNRPTAELFERGMSLSEDCRKRLEEAETRVETLIRKEGKIVAEPFRPEKSEK